MQAGSDEQPLRLGSLGADSRIATRAGAPALAGATQGVVGTLPWRCDSLPFPFHVPLVPCRRPSPHALFSWDFGRLPRSAMAGNGSCGQAVCPPVQIQGRLSTATSPDLNR